MILVSIPCWDNNGMVTDMALVHYPKVGIYVGGGAHWVIGRKTYEPEKIRVFLEFIWRRLPKVLQGKELFGRVSDFEKLNEMFSEISRDLKALISGLRVGEETTPVAERMFSTLKQATVFFLEMYFRNRSAQVPARSAEPYLMRKTRQFVQG